MNIADILKTAPKSDGWYYSALDQDVHWWMVDNDTLTAYTPRDASGKSSVWAIKRNGIHHVPTIDEVEAFFHRP